MSHPRYNSRSLPRDEHASSDSDSQTSGSSTADSGELVPVTDIDVEEYELLEHVSLEARARGDHELRTAPIFTRDAYMVAGGHSTFPQRGVLGSTFGVFNGSGNMPDIEDDTRLYVNTNAPFSAIVCGVQGSGKSHTVSLFLENMLIPGYAKIGSLSKPLSGLVLHFGEGGPYSQPCEAAWVGVSNVAGVNPPVVRVFVSPSSLNTMRAVYAPLGSHIKVMPLLFSQSELDAQAFLSMMAVGDTVPLYMQIILSILRELGEKYTYQKFMDTLEVEKKKFNPQQQTGLEQRMALLQSFLQKDKGKANQIPARFAAGQLTIIDLSDPFIDSGSACGLFEIVTRLFVRAQVGTGKVLVVDEAHKYLSSGNEKPSGLTQELLSLIRQQRHQAMRVIISTQEPTVVPPVLLDLCAVIVLHRFSSPTWWAHVAKHASADVSNNDAFDKVVHLQTGQALVLATSALGLFHDDDEKSRRKVLGQFGRRCVLIKARKRITADGGASILVV